MVTNGLNGHYDVKFLKFSAKNLSTYVLSYLKVNTMNKLRNAIKKKKDM